MTNFEKLFAEKIQQVLGYKDPAHDLAHVSRVVSTAKKLAEEEGANLDVVIPAAWLHDLVNLAKDHPDRKKASLLAADEALVFLQSVNYSQKYFKEIHHAICAHSFSANIKPETIEAQIVQDADRLDALGAMGLARLFAITTQLGRPFYDFNDPFAQNRPLNDKDFGIDHIYIKLEKIVSTMNTNSARVEAVRRFKFIEEFLDELKKEI
jgi:uncharacterized protein